MADELTGVGKLYGLKRDNFILNPLADHACFARDDIKTSDLADSLDIDLVTGIAPKRLVWGPYGGGKTHTLMRTMDELKGLTKIYAVRIECPDLGKKSRFHDLYREGIMRGLGEEFVIGLIEEAVIAGGLARREEMMGKLKARFGDEEVAKAAMRIIDPSFDRLRLWRWISGVAMSRQDLDDLGQTQDLTSTEAARLAEILCMIGRLLKELRGQTLVLVLDEMERLRAIGPETIPTFVSGFTRLLDPNQTAISILVGTSAAVESELIEVFAENGPVTSRLGSEAKIEIPSLLDPGVGRFIKDVIGFLREPSADLKTLVAEAAKSTSEKISKDYFPFTDEAIESLKSHLMQMMTPREITIKMTRAMGRAYRLKKPVVTADCVQ